MKERATFLHQVNIHCDDPQTDAACMAEDRHNLCFMSADYVAKDCRNG